MATLTKQAAIEKIQKLITKAQEMRGQGFNKDSLALKLWKRGAEATLKTVFGDDSQHLQDLNEVQFYREHRRDTTASQDFNEGVIDATLLLQSILEEIEDKWLDEPNAEPVHKSTRLQAEIEKIDVSETVNNPCVFIGHGRNPLWARLQLFLEKSLGLSTVSYESESRAGESIIPILESMLDQSTFAVLILTAEDETSSGNKRARQNVIHEAGLFQGRLGFKKAILLRQEGTEDFSNVAGLQYISFSGEKIEQTFWELREVLVREGQVK